MLHIDENAIYDRKDLAILFNRSTRTIDRFYVDGLPKRRIRGTNYTFGHEIIKWMAEGKEMNQTPFDQQPVNQKLLKFRQNLGVSPYTRQAP